jgi:hypothetical protein
LSDIDAKSILYLFSDSIYLHASARGGIQMLELRPVCENCGKTLPNDSDEAMICTFECTFCAECVVNVLSNVCPNCGGGFEKRPTRPTSALEKYPAKTEALVQPVDPTRFKTLLEKFRDVDPRKR